jgi:hypothetical protein
MNWRSVSLRRTAWQFAMLGVGAGLCAAAGYEGALGLMAGLWGPGLPIALGFLPGAAFGLVLGLLLAPLDELVGHYPLRMLRTAGAGALLGALGGLLTLGPLELLVPVAGGSAALPLTEAALFHWALLGPALGVLSACVAFASGFGIGQPRLGLRRAVWSLGGGLLSGTLLAGAFALLPHSPWFHFAGFGLWAGLLALVMLWREKRFARRWLRVLSAPGEDRILPLQGAALRIGKLESNEIALPFYQEIYPVHCTLRRIGQQYQIVDDETGGMVMVNFRQVQEQTLKTGDLVKIGSALLQYGEVS